MGKKGVGGQLQTRILQTRKLTGKGKHTVKIGQHPRINMVSKRQSWGVQTQIIGNLKWSCLYIQIAISESMGTAKQKSTADTHIHTHTREPQSKNLQQIHTHTHTQTHTRGPIILTLRSPLQGAWVWSLVRKLTSCNEGEEEGEKVIQHNIKCGHEITKEKKRMGRKKTYKDESKAINKTDINN